MFVEGVVKGVGKGSAKKGCEGRRGSCEGELRRGFVKGGSCEGEL